MQPESPSAFEAAVFHWLAAKSDDPALRAQLERAQIRDRESTGCGCYSRLDLPRGAPISKAQYSARGPLHGPSFESSVVEFGGGTLLWFKDGLAHELEIYAFGNYFPAKLSELGDFTLAPGS